MGQRRSRWRRTEDAQVDKAVLAGLDRDPQPPHRYVAFKGQLLGADQAPLGPQVAIRTAGQKLLHEPSFVGASSRARHPRPEAEQQPGQHKSESPPNWYHQELQTPALYETAPWKQSAAP